MTVPVARPHAVLVTGASGFVGRHVVEALLARGHDVIALSRHDTLPPAIRAKCADVIIGDVCEPAVQRSAVRAADSICHFAAHIPDNFLDPATAETCYRVNALATLALATAAVERGVKRFVLGSASNMYGLMDRAADEEDPLLAIDAAPYYFMSKLAAEVYLRQVSRDSPMDAVVLRIGTPYGPGEPGRKVVPTFLRLAAEGKSLRVGYGGLPRYSFVDVRDVAWCAATAVEHGEPGIYNVASGEHSSLLDLAQQVAATYGDRKLTIDVDPVVPGQPSGFGRVSIAKARRVWKFSPRSLADGLREYRQFIETGAESG